MRGARYILKEIAEKETSPNCVILGKFRLRQEDIVILGKFRLRQEDIVILGCLC